MAIFGKEISLTISEINYKLKNGDLACIPEVREWLDTHYYGTWTCPFDFNRLLINSDGATLHALINLPKFYLLSRYFLEFIGKWPLEDNPLFLEKLSDALLPHLEKGFKPLLRGELIKAIATPSTPVSVLEFHDSLWSKTTSNDSNEFQVVKDLYVDIHRKRSTFNDTSLVEAIIRTGIPRHMNAMLEIINDPSHTHTLDSYTRSKLIEWAVCINVNVNEIPMLKNIKSKLSLLAKYWYDEREYFTSKIKHISNHFTQQKPESIQESIMPKILEQLENCADMAKRDEKRNAVAWLLNEICKATKLEHSYAQCEPLLTGSAAECTQALYIDEFDFVLRTDLELYTGVLASVVTQIKGSLQHPHLAFQSMHLDAERKYPCLHVTWVDGEFRNTPISIDIVPATRLLNPVTLPHHNFLSVSKLTPAHRWTHEISLLNPRKNSHDLLCDTNFNTIFSLVENELIKSLPKYIFEGYRLAKAVRVTKINQPIVQLLIALGVTHDITTLIRTYHLKTCVFVLTQCYVCDESDIERNDRWNWAIAIFVKLREFVMLGDAREFFATDKYMFRGSTLECGHSAKEFTAALPRFRCCRVRKARLLIVDQILRVLRVAKSKYHPRNKPFGKALSKAVNTSILQLI